MTTPTETTEVEATLPLSKADLGPLAGILLVALVLYAPMFFGRPVMPDTWERYEPWNSVLEYEGPLDERIANSNNDTILLYIPWNALAHRELNEGRIPAWDPYCLMGVPLVANHLVPVFHPIYALTAWLASPLFILGISGFVHTLIMGVFFYLFIREWLGSRLAAWLSASFLVVSLLPSPHYQPWPMTLAWFPAIWFFYERWLKHRNPWAGLWMALCWAGPFLAGYPSLTGQMSLFTAVWFLVRGQMMADENRPDWRSRLGILIWPFVLAMFLSAVQNVPTLMASMDSDRMLFKTSEDLAREASHVVPPNEPWQTHAKRLLQTFIPFKWRGNDFLNRGYAGFFPVFFALMSLGWLRKKGYPVHVFWISLIVAPFALIPALNFALYWITRGVLIDPNPPLEVFGFLILMLMAVGVDFQCKEHALRLSKCGDELHREDRKTGAGAKGFHVGHGLALGSAVIALIIGVVRHESLLFGWGTAVFGLVAAGILVALKGYKAERRRVYIFVTSMQMILLLQAVLMGLYLIPTYLLRSTPEPAMKATQSIIALRDFNNPARGGEWGRMIRWHPEPVNVMLLDQQPYCFYPNLGTYFGIPDAFGYHNLAPKSRFDYLCKIQDEAILGHRGIPTYTDPVDPFDPVLERVGVRYILTIEPLSDHEPVYRGEGLYVYENPDAWPRVAVVPLDAIEHEPTSEWSLTELPDNHAESEDFAEIVVDEPGHQVIRSGPESAGDRRLIINEGYSKGWRATVDGEELGVNRVNGILMGVTLPPGEHEVKLRYRIPGLLEGWIISCAAILFWVLGALRYAVKTRQL